MSLKGLFFGLFGASWRLYPIRVFAGLGGMGREDGFLHAPGGAWGRLLMQKFVGGDAFDWLKGQGVFDDFLGQHGDTPAEAAVRKGLGMH